MFLRAIKPAREWLLRVDSRGGTMGFAGVRAQDISVEYQGLFECYKSKKQCFSGVLYHTMPLYGFIDYYNFVKNNFHSPTVHGLRSLHVCSCMMRLHCLLVS